MAVKNDGDPSLERDAAWYNRAYRRAKIRGWRSDTRRNLVWYPALVLAEPPILDVGCGVGQLAQICREFGIPYTAGIDFSRTAIAIAKRRSPRDFFIEQSAFKHPILTGPGYRTAVFLEVLEHINADLELLSLIPPGRIVVGSVPDFKAAGHVRQFESKDLVRQRYGTVLNISRIVEERSGGKSAHRWFIFKGVKNKTKVIT